MYHIKVYIVKLNSVDNEVCIFSKKWFNQLLLAFIKLGLETEVKDRYHLNDWKHKLSVFG